MASLRQKPSGRWEARYRDARGQLHARTFDTKTAGRRWAAEMEADLRRGEWVDPRLGRTTFGEWATEYLATIVHLRTVTRGDYEQALRKHILPAFADQPIAHIEQVDVRRFFAAKLSAGLAPKSLQKIRLVFRQVLELARGSGAIKTNPCDGVRLPRAVQAEPIFLSAAQVELLAQATRPPYNLLVRFAAATGLRPSELCGLRVGRLNLVKGTVEVAEALTVIAGRTEVGPTKSYARRTVGLPRSICDELAAFLAARAEERGTRPQPEDFVFTAPMGGPLRRDLLLKRFLRPAVQKVGLPPQLRVHDLRHTCVSLLIELGAHPKAIQERLGHSSITVTMDVYGHLFPSLSEALTERLDDVFRAARTGPSAGADAQVVDLHRR
jgi:integrase